MGDPVNIVVNGNEKTIGQIEGDRFVAQKHKKGFCRKFQGYGLNHEAFLNEIKPYVDTIIIEQKLSDGRMFVYMSTPMDWEAEGTVAKLGEDKQIFLSLDEMSFEGEFSA